MSVLMIIYLARWMSYYRLIYGGEHLCNDYLSIESTVLKLIYEPFLSQVQSAPSDYKACLIVILSHLSSKSRFQLDLFELHSLKYLL